MSGFLLDNEINVPSELTRPQSEPLLEQWPEDANDDELFNSWKD